MASSRAVGTLMVVVAALSFGSLSVFSRRLAAEGVSVPMMLTVRFAGAALVLWALALVRGQVQRLGLKRWAGFAGLGLLYVGEAWTYFESALRIPVALTALLLYLYPVIVAVLSFALFKEHLGRAGLIALVLASAGVALAVGNPPGGALDLLGVLLGLGTAFIYSAYVLIGARVSQGVPTALGSAWLMTTTAAVFGLATLATGTWDLQAAARGWPDLVGLVMLGTALPIPLLLGGLARVGSTQGSIISSLEPISAAVCGALFLGEALGPSQLAGITLVLSALVVLVLRARRA